MNALRPSTWRAVAWTLATRQAERVFGVISIAILARLLSPGDLGLVAMAASVAAIVEVLSAFGFDWALIRLPVVTREHYDTAWTLRLISGLAIFAVLSAAAYPVARLFSRPAILPIVIAMGFNALLGSAGNIWMTEYRRASRFDQEFKLNFFSRVAGFVTSIVWAAHARSYWALIFGTTASRFTMSLLSYRMHPRRPRWDLSRHADLLHFSAWLLLGNATDVLRSRFSDMWIGRNIGAREVGLYSMAQEIAGLASTEIAEPVNRAVFARYSQFEGEVARLRPVYLRVSGLIWSIGVPAALGIGLCAPDIVAILLGAQWSGATGVLRVLTCANVMNIMAANTHYVYWALGRSRFVTLLSIAGAAVFILFTLILGRYHGVLGVAWAQVVAAAVVLVLNFTALAKTLDLKLTDMLARNYRVVLASGAMGGLVLAMQPVAGAAQFGHWPRLLLFSGSGAIGYLAALLCFWGLSGGPPGPEEEIWGFLRRTVRRVAPT